MKTYKARIADALLKRRLQGKGAVLIEGLNGAEKRLPPNRLPEAFLYIDDPEKEAQNLTMAEINPKDF